MYVYLHGMEVKGSPFSLRIGKDVREPRTGAKDLFRPDRKVSRYFIYTYIFLKAVSKDFFKTWIILMPPQMQVAQNLKKNTIWGRRIISLKS